MRRRDILSAAAVLGAAATLGDDRMALAKSGPAEAEGVARSLTRVSGFPGGELDFQLMRSLGAINYGGATPGEVFAARGAIKGEDVDAWPPAFAAMGARVEKAGDTALARNHKVTAREHFLRASMYFRAAEYFSDAFGDQVRALGLASRAAFLKAAPLLADRIEPVEIPFEGATLRGYFMVPATGARGGRTLVVVTGFDGTAEELYFEAAAAGLERGYNVFIAEGPGQAGTMRFHPELKFRPDYEKPIAAMLDAALARREVAAERLALYGISLGGYFATRAGEHDSRIKALVANSPIVDMHAYFVGFIGPEMVDNPPPLTLADVDGIPDAEFPRDKKLGFKSACRRYGVDSFAAWMNRLKDFTAVSDLPNIRCPSLAMVGEGEGKEAIAQWERFAASVSGPATKRLFTAAEGADMHCQMGNLPLSCAVIYDWLDEVFGA